jgi:hypothetical protein
MVAAALGRTLPARWRTPSMLRVVWVRIYCTSSRGEVGGAISLEGDAERLAGVLFLVTRYGSGLYEWGYYITSCEGLGKKSSGDSSREQ